MPRGFLPTDCDAVLFDVDGTLVDSLGMIIPGLADTFETFGGRRPEESLIASLIGLPLREQVRLVAGDEPTDEQAAGMKAYALERFESYVDNERFFEPAIEALRKLKRRGLATALVTSKCSVELEPFLSRFPAADSVDTVVCSSNVSKPKPDPESALLACERLGVAPHRAVMIGDSIFDARCASSAGIPFIAVSYGAGTRANLQAEGPVTIFDSPEELLAWAKTATPEISCPVRS